MSLLLHKAIHMHNVYICIAYTMSPTYLLCMWCAVFGQKYKQIRHAMQADKGHIIGTPGHSPGELVVDELDSRTSHYDRTG